MNALELLLEASACGVHLQTADGRLSYDAPRRAERGTAGGA